MFSLCQAEMKARKIQPQQPLFNPHLAKMKPKKLDSAQYSE